MNKYKSFVILVALFLFQLTCSVAYSSSKLSLKDIAKEAKAQSDSLDMRTKLANAECYEGMFTAWVDSTGKLFLQLPEESFGQPYLLVNRINSLSQTSDYVAGQMCGEPMIIKFTKDPQKGVSAFGADFQ